MRIGGRCGSWSRSGSRARRYRNYPGGRRAFTPAPPRIDRQMTAPQTEEFHLSGTGEEPQDTISGHKDLGTGNPGTTRLILLASVFRVHGLIVRRRIRVRIRVPTSVSGGWIAPRIRVLLSGSRTLLERGYAEVSKRHPADRGRVVRRGDVEDWFAFDPGAQSSTCHGRRMT